MACYKEVHTLILLLSAGISRVAPPTAAQIDTAKSKALLKRFFGSLIPGLLFLNDGCWQPHFLRIRGRGALPKPPSVTLNPSVFPAPEPKFTHRFC